MSEFMLRGKPDRPKPKRRKRVANPKALSDLWPGDRAEVVLTVSVTGQVAGQVMVRPTRYAKDAGHWVDGEPFCVDGEPFCVDGETAVEGVVD